MGDLLARAVVEISASRERIWDTLLAPATIRRILPVDEVLLPWRAGEPFAWTFDFLGRPTRVDGHVHVVESPTRLVFTFEDPHERVVHGRQRVHTVTISLASVADAEPPSTRVTVTQDANGTPISHAHAEGGWRLALAHLRALVEGADG